MVFRRDLVWVGLLSFLVVPSLFAAGQDAFSFLLMTPSPRAAAMGQAYVAVGDGPETVLYNPSGLGFHKQHSFYLQSVVPGSVGDVTYQNLIFVDASRSSVWALQAGFLQMGNFTRTVVSATQPDGFTERDSFSAYGLVAGLSMGHCFNNALSLGSGFRFVREFLEDSSANGYAFDVGMLYRDPEAPIGFGVAFQNYGQKVKHKDEEFELPTAIRAGFSSSQKDNFMKFKLIPENTVFSFEYFKPIRGESALKAGFEIPFVDTVFFRTGYNYMFKNQELGRKLLPAGITLGLGLKVKSFLVDYALVSEGELGFVHALSLAMKWGT